VSPVEVERRNRIRLALAAYAYEFHDDPIMSDGDYDTLSLSIDPKIKTGNRRLDWFFSTRFDPSTGVWVREHPDLDRLAELYTKQFA